ncbi:hypothetical protein GCM10011506_18960 [Marivirga lumbricoides]|uniref:Toxin-antitoxin system YwqK family antitoxin n=1 Tax=Marivirga lumbricoides TaxID=1046115 RepID=A0ABQ1M5Z0_9BACT|nr:hypothetical protein GCM10011506_18960 [Marivirga lumbricoides]
MNFGFLTRHILILCVLVLFESCTLVEKEYYPSGNIAYEYNIENGKKNGVALKYYESGELMQKSNWIEGEKVGKAFIYYKNGKKKYVAEFENSKQHGWTFCYDSLGNLRGKQEFVEGNLHGKFEEYYINGQISVKGKNNFKERTKVSYEYYENGDHKKYVFQRNDSLIYYKTYDSDGKIIDTYFTINMKEENNKICFILEKSIMPEDKLMVEVLIDKGDINSEKLSYRDAGSKVCIDTDKFKNKEKIKGYLCEILKDNLSSQGCNKFSFDLL